MKYRLLEVVVEIWLLTKICEWIQVQKDNEAFNKKMMLLNEQIEQDEDSEDFDDIPENDIAQEVSDRIDGV